jgi:hypothetical protein
MVVAVAVNVEEFNFNLSVHLNYKIVRLVIMPAALASCPSPCEYATKLAVPATLIEWTASLLPPPLQFLLL